MKLSKSQTKIERGVTNLGILEGVGGSSLGGWFLCSPPCTHDGQGLLKCQLVSEPPLRLCQNPDCWARLLDFLMGQVPGRGLRICIANSFSGGADATGPAGDHTLRTCRLERPPRPPLGWDLMTMWEMGCEVEFKNPFTATAGRVGNRNAQT